MMTHTIRYGSVHATRRDMLRPDHWHWQASERQARPSWKLFKTDLSQDGKRYKGKGFLPAGDGCACTAEAIDLWEVS